MLIGFVVAVFVAAYLLIIFSKFRRSVIAFSAGLILAFAGIFSDFSFERVGELVDFNTIGLLIGMMIIVGVLRSSGFFHYASVKVITFSRGRIRLLISFILLTIGLFSALLDNVTTIILFAPILFFIADITRKSPVQMTFAAIMAANIGGAATLIGDPPNILIGSASGLGFIDFLLAVGPIAILMLLFIVIFMDIRVFRHFADKSFKPSDLPSMDPSKAILSRRDLKVSLAVFVIVIVGFAFHGVLSYEPSLIALAGAAAALLLTGKGFSDIASDIEWDTLLFFVGLFLLSSALHVVGVSDVLSSALSAVAVHQGLLFILLLWITAVLSAFIGAVPTVAVLIPIMRTLTASYGIPIDIWWAISIGACFGGSATITGSAANMVGIGLMEKHMGTSVTYYQYLRFSLIPTLFVLLIGTLYISLRFAF